MTLQGRLSKGSLAFAAIAALPLFLAGCIDFTSEADQRPVVEDHLGPGVSFSPYDINAFPLNRLVCDPFNANNAPTPQQGIKASLFYRGDGQPTYNKAGDYPALATPSSQVLFFTDINVPTRMFDTGFASQTQDVLKNDAGQILIEYFGLRFSTVIKLADTDPTGDYEFAVLSDDGVRMRAKNADGTWSEMINNDGDHPTRMGCSSSVVHFDRGTEVEIELDYYQGPRYHIANVLLWRPVAQAGLDSQCGKSGNEYFFNPNANSTPLQPYNDLLARGWTPVSTRNFFIPGSGTQPDKYYNPCVNGVDPVISDFVIEEIASNDVWVSWTTDIPATSQLLVTKVSTGAATLTPTDNILRTSHSLRVSRLQMGTTYRLRAVSISNTLGKAITTEAGALEFTTP